MTEIELKAHVYEKEKLIQTLKTFATYEKTVSKDDTYYHLKTSKVQNGGKDYISVRIRKETQSKENKTITKNYLTYKRKEIRTSENGLSTEVNDENETEILDTKPLEVLLHDIGFVPALKKQKEVIDFFVQTKFGKASLELCNVLGLGDFLEIEILSEKSDEKTVANVQSELKKILKKCNIPEKDIENRYYSEMLAEITKKITK